MRAGVCFGLIALCACAPPGASPPPDDDAGSDECTENFLGERVCRHGDSWAYAHLTVCEERPQDRTGFSMDSPNPDPPRSLETREWSLTVTAAAPGRWDLVHDDAGPVVLRYDSPDEVDEALPGVGDVIAAREVWCASGEGGATVAWRFEGDDGDGLLDFAEVECWDELELPLAATRVPAAAPCTVVRERMPGTSDADAATWCCDASTELQIEVETDPVVLLPSPVEDVLAFDDVDWWVSARAWDYQCGPGSEDCSGRRAYALRLRVSE
jgi:hypothetical protein